MKICEATIKKEKHPRMGVFLTSNSIEEAFLYSNEYIEGSQAMVDNEGFAYAKVRENG